MTDEQLERITRALNLIAVELNGVNENLEQLHINIQKLEEKIRR